MSGVDPLRQLTDELERAAARLRAEQLDPQEAARLVEECARLAGEAAAELERRARAAADAAPSPLAGEPGGRDATARPGEPPAP